MTAERPAGRRSGRRTDRRAGAPTGARLEQRASTATPAAAASTVPQEAYTRLLSHELRTPITVLLGYLDLLRDEALCGNPETVREYVSVIYQRAADLGRLVAELTLFAELTSGQHPTADDPAVPASLEAIAGRLAKALDPARPLTLDISPAATAVAAARQVEVERLRLVLQQLLDNAFRFSPPGSEVAVRAAVVPAVVDGESPRLVVQVINEGPPIRPALRRAIFEPFRQGEDLLRRRHGGLGLGLTVARRAVEGAGGTLTLAPGSPITFRVELPVRKDASSAALRLLRERAALADAQALRAIRDVRALRERAVLADAQALRAIKDLRALRAATRAGTQYPATQ